MNRSNLFPGLVFITSVFYIIQRLKVKMRTVENMQSSGMNSESQSSLVSLRMQPTEIDLQNFLDSIGVLLKFHEFPFFEETALELSKIFVCCSQY